MEAIRLLVLACSLGGGSTDASLLIQRECQAKLIMCYKMNSAISNDVSSVERCLSSK